MESKYVYLKILDNFLGKIMMKYLYLASLPALILGYIIFVFISSQPIGATSGLITNSYEDVAFLKMKNGSY